MTATIFFFMAASYTTRITIRSHLKIKKRIARTRAFIRSTRQICIRRIRPIQGDINPINQTQTTVRSMPPISGSKRFIRIIIMADGIRNMNLKRFDRCIVYNCDRVIRKPPSPRVFFATNFRRRGKAGWPSMLLLLLLLLLLSTSRTEADDAVAATMDNNKSVAVRTGMVKK